MSATNRLRISIVDMVFLVLALGIPLGLAKFVLNSDGDLPRHLRMGAYILHGGPYQVDPFSFTRTGQPLVLFEWLSEVFFALAHAVGGLAAVAIATGLVLALAYTIIAMFLLRSGVDPLLAYLAALAAAFWGLPHWLARPHIMTLLFEALLLVLLERGRRLWPYFLLFVLWANFHGGFVLGLALTGAYAAGAFLEWWVAPAGSADRARWLARARTYALGLGLALVGSCVNPLGPGLLWKVRETLGDRFVIDNTFEFQSPDFHSFYGKLLAVAILGILTVLTLRARRLRFPRLAVLLMLIGGALYSVRNVPNFVLFVFPLLALECDEAWRRARIPVFTHVRRVFEEGERLARPGRWAAGAALLLVLLAWQHGRLGSTQLVMNRFDPAKFPVTAVARARAAGLSGHVYAEQTWGGYMLYAWPEQKVFIDGLTSFFGAELSKEYVKVVQMGTGWQEVLRKHDITTALIPSDWPLKDALRERGWTTWYSDSTATILRAPGAPPLPPALTAGRS